MSRALRRIPGMHIPRRAFSSLVAVILAACGTAGPISDIPVLEARLARAEAGTDTRLWLAAAYHEHDRPADAIRVLQGAFPDSSEDPAALFLLARASEKEQRFAEARRAYAAFLASNAPTSLKRRVRARVELLRRREMEQAVHDALEQEASLRNTTPAPRAVGVFPLLFAAADSALAPLGRAIAEMLTTDLAQTDRLTVVERASIQFLIDEIRLDASNAVDPLTAARAGRLLGAGRIVQGRLDGTEARLRLEALIVRLAATRDSTGTPARVEGELGDLFDMEKQLVLALFADLGLELTAAERERVLQRPTSNVEALLAFGTGLEADDANRWTEAVAAFRRAVTLDGDFELARIWLERSRYKLEASREDDDDLDETARDELGWTLPAWLRMRLPFALIERIVPDPDLRNPLSEIFGVEGLDRRARVEIIIKPPGGR